MADVARLAGVSPATVSRVLNRTKHVDPALEEKVREAVRTLNYEPDQNARWLSARRSNVVGLVVPGVVENNLGAFLHACSISLEERGYSLMVALSDGDKRMELELLRAQLQSHVSGIMLVTPFPDNKSRSLLRKSGIPLLYALNPDPTGRFSSVVFDEERAAEALLTEVLRARLRMPRIGEVVILAGVKQQDSATSRRVQGFLRALQKLDAPPPRVVDCEGTIDGAYRVSLSLLQETPPRILAATTDYFAIAAARAAHDAGVAIPRQLAVLGFGENVYSHTCSPTITTVRFDGRLLGERCGDTIASLMEGKRPQRHVILGFDLVPGESCPLSPSEVP